MRFRDADLGEPGSPSSPIAKTVWLDINWSFTEPPPTGLATGFQVVIYTGTNPDDASVYVLEPIKCNLSDRRLVVSYSAALSITLVLKAAVRTIYPWGFSAWATLAGTTNSVGGGTVDIGVDNLIPNPTSEMGLVAQGAAASSLVNDAVNAYAGSWCRKIGASVNGADVPITPLIACVYGDQFTFSGYVKGSSATPIPRFLLNFWDATGAFVGVAYKPAPLGGSTSYRNFVLHGAVPAGAMYVNANIGNDSGATVGAFHYFDNLSLRRAVLYTHMAADESFRSGNAIGNTGTTAADRVYYRGNNDGTTLGGAPAIATLTVKPQTWDTTNKQMYTEFTLQPTAPSSNLDGMRYAKVGLYRQSVAGTTATLTLLKTYYVPLKDRLYNNSTDSNAVNASINGWSQWDAGINAGFPAMTVQIYNAVGPSDGHCFYSGSAWVVGAALTDNGTTWPAGLTGGTAPATGGGSGGGGTCPAPWTMIDIWDGSQKRADELQVGDILKTIHASTNTQGRWPVKAVRLAPDNERWDVLVEGNPVPYTWSAKHRIMTTNGWKEVNTLEAGDVWTGFVNAVIVSSTYRDIGDVVNLSVDLAGAYCTDGLMSSNIKVDP